jgi:hypothetical protein
MSGEESTMAQRQRHRFAATRQGYAALLRGAIALLVFLALLPGAAAARQAPAPRQKTFATPEAAVKALVAAIKSKNRPAIYAVTGEEMRGTMTTGNRLLDDVNRYELLQAASITRIAPDKDDPKRRIVYFGKQEWPYPAPLVRQGSVWRFDGAAGREEVKDRRIGWNELRTIKACRGYVEAQFDYASKDRNGDGYIEFAQRILSTPGTKDGLYWSTDDANDLSPLGPFFADAAAAVARGEKPQPYNGYFFRILTAQGEHARGGARDYVVDGHMIGGFALVAWPADYDRTGVHTFIVNQLGVIYQKDLGTDTASVVEAMDAFDPDDTWKPVKE